MMTTEMLFDAITQVRDELVDEAVRVKPARKQLHWLKFGSIAAAFTLVIGLGAGVFSGAIPLLPVGWLPGGNEGGSGHEEGSEFMRYAGPVFPMTTLEGGGDLTASRDLTYDFAPWTPVWRSNEELAQDAARRNGTDYQEALEQYNRLYEDGGYHEYSSDLLVSDAYTLSNPTGENRTVTLLYPFVSSFWQLTDYRPALTLDGAELDTRLRAGPYSGAFQGAIGAENQETGSINLKSFNSWEGYRALLDDGRYQAQALEEFPDLSHIPVTVYQFTDSWGPVREPGVTNPSIHAGFSLDYSKTTVLSYGFHGGCFDLEAGIMDLSFSIPEPDLPSYIVNEPCFLIVVGEPLADWQVFATSSGAPEAKEDLEFGVEAGVTVERYDADLESALCMAAERMFGVWDPWETKPDFELYFGLMKLDMTAYGPLSDDPAERYGYGHGGLHESDFAQVDRVFYLETEVTIPAGGSVTVEASFRKPPSFDFYCAHTENQGVYGYDMVTRLGTELDFTAVTARAANTRYTRIVRQNYGFDWDNGVDAVALDPEVEHYYLEVSRAETG